DPAGAVQTLVVLLEMEAVQLAFLGIPVGADPLEDAGSVIERMGEDAHLRVAHRNKRSIEEGPRGIWRGPTPKRGRSGQLLHHAHTPCPDRFRVELGSATRTPRAALLRPLLQHVWQPDHRCVPLATRRRNYSSMCEHHESS